MNERQKHARWPVPGLVTENRFGRSLGRLSDVGEDGITYLSDLAQPEGAEYEVGLNFAHRRKPLLARIKVERCEANDASWQTIARFVRPTPALQTALRTCVNVEMSAPAHADVAPPAIIGGRRVPSTHPLNIQLDGGVVQMPRLDITQADILAATPRDSLRQIHVQEVVAFLNRAGRAWSSNSGVRRTLYVRQICRYLGYSEKMAEVEADLISLMLRSSATLLDIIAADLGDRHVLDEWVRREDCQIRAFPRGLVLHLVPGNSPVAAVTSIVRGLLTKNHNIIKLPSTDPFTATSLAQTFLDLDPDHPVCRACEVVYWPSDLDDLGREIAATADAIVAWGGSDAIAWASKAAAPGVPVVSFGPRRSLALIDADTASADAATALAHDAVVYEQRACFSMREAYVTGDCRSFANLVLAALEAYEDLLPPGLIDREAIARRELLLREMDFDGAEILRSTSGRSSVILGANPAISDHPLHRMIMLYPVENLADAVSHIDADVQTVAIEPYARASDLRDALGAKGVSRLVELGLSNFWRPGGAHDGVYPMSRLVRFVSQEDPARLYGKGLNLPVNQTDIITNGRMTDLLEL